jgi:protein deglycase
MTNVIVPLAQGCEELEAVTIIDLLRRAGVEVTTASLDSGEKVNPVTGSQGIVLIPDMTLDNALKHDYDMVILPGGLPGADHLDNDERIHTLLKKMSREDKYTAAICAAPKVLANAKLLEGKKATSYPGFIDKMNLEKTQITDKSVVHDGKVITSRGPATAMEFALTLIAILKGSEKRDEVASGLLYVHNL